MNHFKRILCFLLATVMVFAMTACIPGVELPGTTGSGETTGATDPTGTTGNSKATYTVTIHTNGGMPMEGINVYLYGDAALSDMKGAAGTDDKGVATFNLKPGEYYIQLQGVAKGFDVQDYYTFTGTTANITLTSGLVENEDVTAGSFQVGDVMYDFSYADNTKLVCPECNAINEAVTAVEDGASQKAEITSVCVECNGSLENATYPVYTLSEVLAEKELVVLNFWFTNCSACVTEFPVLEDAYKMYSDSVEVIAVNGYPTDTENGVMWFESNYGLDLSFPMSKVDNDFNAGCFINPTNGEQINAYPTSVFIDRYGVICAIEVGAMVSLTQWASVFGHFVGENYVQKAVTTLDELIERVEPTQEQPTDEEIAAAIVNGEMTVDFRGEEEDVYSWPFVVTEKDGVTCLKASNQLIYESYAILYADLTLEAGDVVAFDYLISSEAGADFLHVIVEGEAVYSISGVQDQWRSAYCWVAEETGTYTIGLCYIKDYSTDEGDDTVYIDNLRIVSEADIDTPSYIPHQAAVAQDDGSYRYADVYYNEADGYYHVGSKNGPLLLANLLGYTQLVEDNFVYMMALEGDFVIDGHDYLADLTPFCTVASNSALNGYCTVTKELAELLKIVASVKGINDHENEWLKLCKYYASYGNGGKELEDPCAGLSWFSAYEAVLGNGYVDANGEGQNFFYYDGRPIMPRGMWARFTPTKSGAYRITSHTDYTEGLNAWIFDKDGNILYEHDGGEMLHALYADEKNVTMVFYMEAGKDYYIDIALWNVYGVGYVLYDIEYLGESYQLFTACSPGPFTYEEGSDQTIIRGIDAALADDGYYHEVLERDENGNPVRFGSIIYAYFGGSTTLFSQAVYPTMIDLGGFDFSKSDYDLEILYYLDMHDGDTEATTAYLREMWGEDFEVLSEIYQLDDVYAGIYHGEGEDLTEEITAYVAKMIQGSATYELTGCVPVDARLAELLDMLVEKYTFQDVDDAWQKLCFYYQYVGPEA